MADDKATKANENQQKTARRGLGLSSPMDYNLKQNSDYQNVDSVNIVNIGNSKECHFRYDDSYH